MYNGRPELSKDVRDVQYPRIADFLSEGIIEIKIVQARLKCRQAQNAVIGRICGDLLDGHITTGTGRCCHEAIQSGYRRAMDMKDDIFTHLN